MTAAKAAFQTHKSSPILVYPPSHPTPSHRRRDTWGLVRMVRDKPYEALVGSFWTLAVAIVGWVLALLVRVVGEGEGRQALMPSHPLSLRAAQLLVPAVYTLTLAIAQRCLPAARGHGSGSDSIHDKLLAVRALT